MLREDLCCPSFSDNPAGQPLASKRQSQFHQFSPHILSPSLLFMSSSCLILFFLPTFSFLFCFHHSQLLFASLGHVDASVHLRELMTVYLKEENNRFLCLCDNYRCVSVWQCLCTCMCRVTRCTLMAAEGSVASSSAPATG